ncbi:hypothetical protein SEA_ZOOMAN_173 [Microbacterium phage Zooman]|nr:hypothetical protein SEA_ZOOMAN_173 [Microbacterium phage Zooman]
MTNAEEFTIYFKVGAIGRRDEKTETLTIRWDPSLSSEENQARLALRVQVTQMRLQAILTELLADAGPEFMRALSETQE